MNERQLTESITSSSLGEDRYLIFRIATEIFAAPLLSIREIVEPLDFHAVPNDHEYFLGLANLRGQIIGVLDLGRWFGITKGEDPDPGAFLVFDVGETSMAGYVDQVEAVQVIATNQISPSCKIETTIPAKALRGLATINSKLVPIVNLPDLIKNSLIVAAS